MVIIRLTMSRTDPSRRAALDASTAAVLDEVAAFVSERRRAATASWCHRDLSMTHLHVAHLLAIEGAVPMSRLAELLDVALPSATGIVSRMEERSLVRRRHTPHDRRVVLVELTDEGRAVLDEGDVMRRDLLARLIAELSDEGRANVLRAIRDLRDALERVRDHPDATSSTPTSPPASNVSP
jgi:DNA-binding MarR family transcriptional regulator